jgi:hypothetical protein
MKKPQQFAPVAQGTMGDWQKEQARIEQARTEGYTAGAQAVLNYLKDIFEGIEETDLWTEFDMDSYTD